MANPFLFSGGPPSGQPTMDNPFLAQVQGVPQQQPQMAAAAAANPFLTGAAAPPAAPQQQMQYNAFGQPVPQQQPPPAAAAANPFADYGAPAPAPAAMAANPFATPVPSAAAAVATSPPAPAPVSTANLMHQYADQSGHYTQSTAGHSQPEVSSVMSPTEPKHPFGAPPAQQQEPPPPEPEIIAKEEEKMPEPPPPEPEVAPAAPAEEPKAPTPPPPEEEEKEELPPPPPPEPEVELAKAVEEVQISGTPVSMGTPGSQPSSQLDTPNQPSTGSALFGVAPEEVVATEEAPPVDNSEEPTPEALSGPSQGASLFGLENEPEVKEGVVQEEPEPEAAPKMLSTGDAIFADLPMTDVKSTGASIFGVSEESAADTTGAALFGVKAPEEAQPQLGAMSGWDDAFDRKFDSAEAAGAEPSAVVPSAAIGAGSDPFDPFAGTGAGYAESRATAFGAAPASSGNTFGGDFGKLSEADVNNPFLAGEKKDGDMDSPLFDDDTSQPMEPFPRVNAKVDGWEMFIRHPPKKKITAQRYWKKVFVRLVMQGDNPCVQLFENKEAKDAFQELPMQAAYSLSDISHQVFDQYSKIFTLKLQFIFYKERAGIRPGQISKMQKLTGKIGFLAKAVEDADYEGVKEFASDMKKLGVPLEHAPQVSELLKLGSNCYEDLRQFSICVEEKLFKMDAHRDRALTYKTEEIQLTAVDEVFVEQDKTGHVIKQLCRVRVFFLSFLTGMPDVELGVNDLTRMGLEVVGRHDILPVPTEQWIRYEDIEFHSVVDKKEFEKNDHIIKFKPPDACYIEVMRFRVRPPKARELPMQARCNFQITGNKVEIRADMMIPYHHTKAWGQVPCDDVSMRIPLPECWVYLFRTEKHHMSLSQLAVGNLNLGSRMGSVKSAHRRAGKVKGLDRFMGTLESATQELMETSSGQAKYEHQHKSIVWRVPRLPKQGQGSYTNHEFVCRLTLTSFDQMPEEFDKHFYVDFTQPATSVSHTVLRSVSIQGGQGEEPPEKFSKYVSRHEYKMEIEFTEKEANTYSQGATTKRVVTEKEESDRKKEQDAAEAEENKEYPDFPDENGDKKDSSSDSDDD